MDIKVTRDNRFGIGTTLQAAFGTAVADAGAVVELNVKPFEFKHDVTLKPNQTAHGSRDEVDGDYVVVSSHAMPKTTISGDVNLNDFPYWEALFFQYITEGALTPFSKVCRRHATQPDFSANAGYYATIFQRDAVHPRKIADVIAESLKLSWKRGPGETLQFDVGLVGRGNPAACTPSGTWTVTSIEDTGSAAGTSPLVPFWSRFTLNFGGGDVSPWIEEITIDLKRDVFGAGGGTGANFNSYGLGIITGDIDLKFIKDANHATALTNLLAGTPVSGRIGKGNATAGSVVGDFDITFRGLLSEVPTDYGDQAMGTNLKLKIVGADSSTPGLVLTLANAVDHGF